MVAQRTTLISYDNICRDIFLLFEDTRVQIQRCIGMREIVLSNNFSEQHRFRAWRARGKRKLNMSRSTCRNKKANWLFKPISRGDMAIAGNSFQWNDRISPHFYDYTASKKRQRSARTLGFLCVVPCRYGKAKIVVGIGVALVPDWWATQVSNDHHPDMTSTGIPPRNGCRHAQHHLNGGDDAEIFAVIARISIQRYSECRRVFTLFLCNSRISLKFAASKLSGMKLGTSKGKSTSYSIRCPKHVITCGYDTCP